MNSVIFNKWVKEQLVPALPPKSLVMDNASYHSVIKEGTKAPTSATRKGDMQKWLKDKKIPFDGKMKKTELYEIIKLKKPEPVYKTDEFLHGKGHNFCNHIENKIEPQYWKSDHIIEEIPKIIINLDSDSHNDLEGDHDSEGETTDMYWSE